MMNRVETGRYLMAIMIIEFKVKFRTKPSGWVMGNFPQALDPEVEPFES